MYETIKKELPTHSWKGTLYETGVKNLLFKGKAL